MGFSASSCILPHRLAAPRGCTVFGPSAARTPIRAGRTPDTVPNVVRPLLLSILVLGGCSMPPGGFDSPNPGAKLDAITDAAATEDRTHVKDLIECLDSDDPAVRMVSILTLERLTGETLGYDFAANESQREPAVRAWAEWYRQGHAGADTGGATAAGGAPEGG